MANSEIVTNADSWLDRLVKIVGLLGVIMGILYTGYQIQNAAQTNKSALLYKIQSDGREVLKVATGTDSYMSCVHFNTQCTKDEYKEAQNGIRFILQFYSSIHNQNKTGALENKYWKIFKEELCNYYKIKAVTNFWSDYGNSYSDSFKEVIKSC